MQLLIEMIVPNYILLDCTVSAFFLEIDLIRMTTDTWTDHSD